MPWIEIKYQEINDWNDKLKNTIAAYNQFPYYVSSEYNSLFSRAVFIKYVHDNNEEVAFAAIIEIGFFPFKIGVIDEGPVPLHNEVNLSLLIDDLKKYARKRHYMHLQIRPPVNSKIDFVLQADKSFENNIYFPFHEKVECDWNIYNKPREVLLDTFKAQCRRKIVLAGRVAFKFSKVKSAEELKDVKKLLKEVQNTKGFGFLPFRIYEAIYKKGRVHNLCDIYTVHLNNEIVNAVLIVKDGHSFCHYTSAFVIKNYNPNESPPAKLHYNIMQDCFYTENKDYYNISFGGSDNLIRFKELFNPIEVTKPNYYTYIIKKKRLKIFSAFTPGQTALLRTNLKKIGNFLSRIF